MPGGVGRPHDCIARHRVAVVVPYRDRREHLNILLSHLHPMLQRQQLDYRIYVVEQVYSDRRATSIFPLPIFVYY